MFCPACEGEFRPGFTRCGACDVALVPSLDERGSPTDRPRFEGGADPAAAVELASFCGFLDLSEARRARDLLRRVGIRWEIGIREAPDSPPEGEAREEYWLRVDAARATDARVVLGYDEPEPPEVDESDDDDFRRERF